MKKYLLFLMLFVAHSVFADDLFTNTIINGCGDSLFYNAVFTPIQYNCALGYYLPADATVCVPCPTGNTCEGGTFIYNKYKNQGIQNDVVLIQNAVGSCSNNFQNFSAVFVINSYTCTPGYYLPANVDECTACPNGSFCLGGTFTFNETTDQGIYHHVLHVGDDIVYLRSDKLTTPSLHVKIGNDIFYANMTETQTYMNKDSTHYLKIQYDNNLYYVCDDTTCPQ